MPTYEYECEACTKGFEIYQSIHDDSLVECPECGSPSLFRVIHPPIIRDKTTPKTLGALADKNNKKLSQEQKDPVIDRRQVKREITQRLLEKVKNG